MVFFSSDLFLFFLNRWPQIDDLNHFSSTACRFYSPEEEADPCGAKTVCQTDTEMTEGTI